MAPAVQASSETLPSASSAAAVAAAAVGVTGSGNDAAASWQLEVFGTRRTLSEAESAQIEKAYCDPNNNTVSMSVEVSYVMLIRTGHARTRTRT